MFFKKKKNKTDEKPKEKESEKSFFEKIKSKFSKKNKENEKKISFFKLLSFSDWIDKLIMVIGFAAALGAAAVYPLMFLLYGEVAKTLVNYGRDNTSYASTTISLYSNNTSFIFTSTSSTINETDKCSVKPQRQQDYDNKISEIVNYYVLLGFITLFFEYLAHVSWNSASERQIKKMRFMKP
uniref:ATP-binding cassette transporter subfamily B member 1-like protein X1 n=1 Tax=Brachionus rotundiformis TaxID=96890 RepID=A0A7H9SQ95_9BILA|nr:ATP-binding cassette transporter subfamily B member 1-like protein X1 [Brachionus rotundiformis]